MNTEKKANSQNNADQRNGTRTPKSDTGKEVPGEAMHDSMTESAPNNDNTKIPNAERMTNERGELNAEAFKKSYQGKSPEAKQRGDSGK